MQNKSKGWILEGLFERMHTFLQYCQVAFQILDWTDKRVESRNTQGSAEEIGFLITIELKPIEVFHLEGEISN